MKKDAETTKLFLDQSNDYFDFSDVNDRQKEMHYLYMELRSALHFYDNTSKEKRNRIKVKNLESSNTKININIIDEIKEIQSESYHIREFLKKPKFSTNLRVHGLLKQLDNLDAYLTNLSIRASMII